MVEKEHDKATRELNLTSEWLATERARADVVEASLVAKSTHLDKSMAKGVKLGLQLVEMPSQMGKDLVEALMALDEAEARVAKVEEALGEAGVKP